MESFQIGQAAHDVNGQIGGSLQGRLFLIPSSIQANEIVNVLREGYDVNMLTNGFRQLINKLALDLLLIDTHPGLNEETLFSLAISHVLVIIMRPDQQDYEGTGVTIQVARSLEVPRMLLVVNKTPEAFVADEVRARVEQTRRLAVMLPLCCPMSTR